MCKWAWGFILAYKEVSFDWADNPANLLNPLSSHMFYYANALLKPANELVLSSQLAEISKPLAYTKPSDYKEFSKLAELAGL